METAVRATAVFFFHAVPPPPFLLLLTCRSTVLHLLQRGCKCVLLEVVKVREWEGEGDLREESDNGTLERGQTWVYKCT